MSAKEFTIVTILSLLAGGLFAQNAAPYTYINNMVQPAPNAAALGKYADYPVSYYTGVPNISVPIYDLKDGGINLPISLSYHGSGIKVSEVASWVGLGWALNAGGIITRTVRGAPDEGTRKPASFTAGPRGYFKDRGLSTFPLLPYPINGTTSDPTNSFVAFTEFALNQCALDCEPDLFTFNFNGHTGKFVFDENRTAHTLEDDNIKIEVDFDDTRPFFNSWKITTDDGIQYFFGENNTFEVTNPVSSTGTIDIDSQAPSSWYLTRIYNPNTKETATFSYTPETYSYTDLGGESKITVPDMNGQLNLACDNTGIVINLINTTVTGYRLTGIATNNYTVNFVANTARLDLGTTTANRLDIIKVYNNASQCIRQVALNYNYFISTPATTAAVAQLLANQYGNASYDTRRLKLLSLTESSGDGTLQKPPYIFSYNETIQLPRRMSYDQDEWGYSNNAPGDENAFFTPPLYNGACVAGGGLGGGATRTSKWPDMSAFSLTNIRDPLGANTNFVFEANIASNTSPEITVGGLRIQKISVTDNVTGNVTVKSYNYNSSGILYNMPVHLIPLQNEYYWNYPTGGYIGNSYTSQPNVGILTQAQSVVPLQNPQGNHIGYTQVTETFGANGEGGYTIRRFSQDEDPLDLSSKLDVSNFTLQGYINGVSGLYGSGQFNQPPGGLSYGGNYAAVNDYPFAPQQIDLERGKLLLDQIYDSAGNIIESHSNTYENTINEDALIRGVKCLTTNGSVAGGPVTWNALTFYNLQTGISHLVSSVNKIDNGGNIAYGTESNYSYDSPYHTLPTSETTTDSEGNTISTLTYYSFDYNNTATTDNVFGKMKDQNLLLPVDKSTWRNGELTGEKITKFTDVSTDGTDVIINPASVYSMESTVPLTAAQANESQTWTAPLNTLIPNNYLISKINFTYDGNTGKMTGQQLTNDKSQAIQWSLLVKLPVALVDNAKNNVSLKEFYYEGFEENAVTGINTTRAHTGNNSVSAPYSVNWALPNSRSYVITYWYLSNGKWVLKPEQAFSGSMALTGGTAYDDIRIHPTDADMITYTYDLTGNPTSTTDARNLTTYYEYDSFQRLLNIKDNLGNIVKTYCYNYGVQPSGGCAVPQTSPPVLVYQSDPQSGPFTRNNCGSTAVGSTVTYNLQAGAFTSTISIADANQQALAYLNAQGPNYANTNGSCTPYSQMGAFSLVNSTNLTYQVSFSSSSTNMTVKFTGFDNPTVYLLPDTYTISIYPLDTIPQNGSFTIQLTGQADAPYPVKTYTGIMVGAASEFNILVY